MARGHRKKLAAAALTLLLGLAVVAERQRWFARLLGAPAEETTWIWPVAWSQEVEERAFFLAHDVELVTPPSEARLEVGGDPEYIVRVNGRRVGAGVWEPERGLDVYEVGPLLRPGRNRLLLEMRSAVGSGGAALRLVAAGGEELARTGGDWRVYLRGWRALMNLDEPLPNGAPAEVLGDSPLARWGLPKLHSRPLYSELVTADAVRAAPLCRSREPLSSWREQPSSARRILELGDVAECDFGSEVTGIPQLDFDPVEPVEGLLFFADRPLESLDRVPDRVLLGVAGLGFWQDAAPRRFRYLTVVAMPSLRRVGAIELTPQAASRFRNPEPLRGLFGWEIEPVRSPAVERLLRRVPRPSSEAAEPR